MLTLFARAGGLIVGLSAANLCLTKEKTLSTLNN
jgi:hypothetical protein